VRVWATTDAVTSNLAVGATANVDLLADFVGIPTIGMTVVRTHLLLVPLGTVALNDRVVFGIIAARLTDIADPAGAGLTTPLLTDLDWRLWESRTAAPTYNLMGSTNIIDVDLKSKTRLHEKNDRYMLSILNNATVATTFRVSCRTLTLLP